jgi:hypothetical protein
MNLNLTASPPAAGRAAGRLGCQCPNRTLETLHRHWYKSGPRRDAKRSEASPARRQRRTPTCQRLRYFFAFGYFHEMLCEMLCFTRRDSEDLRRHRSVLLTFILTFINPRPTMCKETGAASCYAGGGGDCAVHAAKELPRHCIAAMIAPLDAATSDREEELRQLVPTSPPRALAFLMPDEHLREIEEARVRPLVNGFAELQLTIQASELSQSSMHRFGQLVIQAGGFLQRDGHLVDRPEVPDGAVCGQNLHQIGSAVSTGTTTGIAHLGGVLTGVGKLAQAASYSMKNPVARKLVCPRQPPAASDVASK